jgi:transcriptional regulator with XRE-family HTH domain
MNDCPCTDDGELRALVFSSILQGYARRQRRTAAQLSRLSGVPKSTILNWLSGKVKKPREWQQIAKLAGTLSLTGSEVNDLLEAAGHPSLSTLLAVEDMPREDVRLLSRWSSELPSTDNMEQGGYLKELALVNRHYQRWLSQKYHMRGGSAISYEDFLNVNSFRSAFAKESKTKRAFLLRCAIQNGMGGEWGKWLIVNTDNEEIVYPLMMALSNSKGQGPIWRAAIILEKTFGTEIDTAFDLLNEEDRRGIGAGGRSLVFYGHIIGARGVENYLEAYMSRHLDGRIGGSDSGVVSLRTAIRVLQEIRVFSEDIDKYSQVQSVRRRWLKQPHL